MSSEPYIFLGLRDDGSIPAIDVAHDADAVGALQRARAFLREHASCTAVEVWLDGRLISTVCDRSEPPLIA